MTAANGLGQLRANRLHVFLLNHAPDEPLPSMRSIGDAIAIPGAHLVCSAFDRLATEGRIQTMHGTRSQHRGHRIVKLVPQNRTLKTKDCPLELPQC
jgi:hypothetical protein